MQKRAAQTGGRLLAALRQLRWAGSVPARGGYAAVTDTDLSFFESVLGPSGVVTDPHELQPFNRRVGWQRAA